MSLIINNFSSSSSVLPKSKKQARELHNPLFAQNKTTSEAQEQLLASLPSKLVPQLFCKVNTPGGRVNQTKASKSLKFGTLGKISANAKMENTLVSMNNTEIGITAVKMSAGNRSMTNIGMQLLSPSLDVTVFNVHKGGLTSKDLEPLKVQIGNIESLLDKNTDLIKGQYRANLAAANENLSNSLAAAQRNRGDKEVKKYLRAAEQLFLLAKSEPLNFEYWTEAKMGYGLCRTLLGEPEDGQREYLETLRTMAGDERFLKRYINKVIEDDPSKKQALTEDLLYLQENGAIGLPALFQVGFNRYLDDMRLRENYLSARIDNKQIRNIQFEAGQDFKNHYLIGADFRGSSLRGADFEGQDLSYANFEGVDLTGANLKNANLYKAKFDGHTILENADLRGAKALKSGLAPLATHGKGIYDFKPKKADGINLSGLDLQNVNFGYSASLDGANFENCNLNGSSFSNFPQKSNFKNAKLQKANFDHGGILNRKTVEEPCFEGADLTKATIHMPRLIRPSFKNANLTDLKLYSNYVLEPNFERANLKGFSFSDVSTHNKCSFGAEFFAKPTMERPNFKFANIKEEKYHGGYWGTDILDPIFDSEDQVKEFPGSFLKRINSKTAYRYNPEFNSKPEKYIAVDDYFIEEGHDPVRQTAYSNTWVTPAEYRRYQKEHETICSIQ